MQSPFPLTPRDLERAFACRREEFVDGRLTLSDRSGRNDVLLIERPSGFGTILKRLRDSKDVTVSALEHRAGRPLPWNANPSNEALSSLGAQVRHLHMFGRSTLPAAAFPAPFSHGWPATDDLPNMSWAQSELIGIVQTNPELSHGLSACLEGWQPECKIHGDLRDQNVLLTSDIAVSIIDWETSGLGDPAWDLGCLLGERAGAWVDAQVGPISPYRVDVQSAGATLWQGYVGGGRGVESGLAARAARFAGLRMIQRSLETTQYRVAVGRTAWSYLQVAANIFADPRRAVGDLFGISH